MNLSRINPLRPNKEVSRALDLSVNAKRNLVSEASGEKIDCGINVALGRVPFVRTERPGHSCRNEEFHFLSKLFSQISQILNTMSKRNSRNSWREAYLIFKMTDPAMVLLASSEKRPSNEVLRAMINKLNSCNQMSM